MANDELAAERPAQIRETIDEDARYVVTPRPPWPERLKEQAQAVVAMLAARGGPATAQELAAAFDAAPPERVAEVLEMLAGLGQVAVEEEGQTSRFVIAS